MLTRFEVSNFMNFKGLLIFDLDNVSGYQFNQDCVNKGVVSKGIIYGKNATGKTNLSRAIEDIVSVVRGINLREHNFLNADSDEETAYFHYEFRFENNEVTYEYEKNNVGEMTTEKLLLDDKVLFDLDFMRKSFRELSLNLSQIESIQTDKYIEVLEEADVDSDEEVRRLPFLRFLLNNAALPSESLLRKLEDYVLRMRFIGVGSQLSIPRFILDGRVRTQIDVLSEGNNLADFESFLNSAGIVCQLSIEELPDGKKELYFSHHAKMIPFFDTASSGTKSLANLFMRLLMLNRNPSFIYMDEFDAFYHYEMSEHIVNLFKTRFPEAQVIMTTHNTNLMSNQLMRADCLFILSSIGTITPLCNATERELREGHNLEKLYIGGEFEDYE